MKKINNIEILKELDNGCFIGTMGYSLENVEILKSLLMSFAEQYGEVVSFESAKDELMLYQQRGKLFIYFDSNFVPVSMNGCVFDYDNDTVDFVSNRELKNMYFYGLSTLKSYRGKGACTALVNYSIDYAKSMGIDYVYARTDLIGSNSEGIMKKAGFDICCYDDMIISEWVDVSEEKGDYRLHLWLPLANDIKILPKGEAMFANKETRLSCLPKVMQLM